MSMETLTERRRWYQFFPEGKVEFLIISRVAALLLLLAIVIVTDAQRPVAFFALGGILWLDYLLMTWWIIHLAMDVNAFSSPPRMVDSTRRLRISLIASLPSAAALLGLLPWSKLLWVYAIATKSRPVIVSVIVIASLVMFVIFAAIAYQKLRSIGIGPRRWTFLMLVPLLHFFALHRLVAHHHARLDQEEKHDRTDADETVNLSLALADVMWVLCMLLWLIVWLLAWKLGRWPEQFPYKVVPILAVLISAIFAVADMAAIENLQHRFVKWLRSLG